MRIFVLEDNKERCKWFREQLQAKSTELVITHTAKEGKEILSKTEFDRLYLDHDLGGRTFISFTDKETGSEIVRYIIEKGIQKEAIIFVHSLNPASYDSMVVPLNKANYHVVYRPFSVMHGQCLQGQVLL